MKFEDGNQYIVNCMRWDFRSGDLTLSSGLDFAAALVRPIVSLMDGSTRSRFYLPVHISFSCLSFTQEARSVPLMSKSAALADQETKASLPPVAVCAYRVCAPAGVVRGTRG